MADKGTIRIPRDEFERHNEQRKANGQTWVEYLNSEAPERVDVDTLIDDLGAAAGGPGVDDSKIAAAVVRQFDYAELSKRVADELEGRMR